MASISTMAVNQAWITNMPGRIKRLSHGHRRLIPTVAFVEKKTDASATDSYTFNTVNLGVVAPRREVIIYIHYGSTLTRTFDSITVAGQAATIHQKTGLTSTYQMGSAIASIKNIIDSTAQIICNFSGTIALCAIAVFDAQNILNSTPFASDSERGSASDGSNRSANIDIPNSGIVVAGGNSQDSTKSFTWTGADEDFDSDLLNTSYGGASQADLAEETARLMRIDWSGAAMSSIAAGSWR